MFCNCITECNPCKAFSRPAVFREDSSELNREIAADYGSFRASPLSWRGNPPVEWKWGNGAKRPRLPLWGSWHGAAVTEEAFPAAAGDSPCRFVALPPHKCGGQERGAAPSASPLGELARRSRD